MTVRREELLEQAYAFVLSTGWPRCRCGRWQRRSGGARGCCCTCSGPRTAWCTSCSARARRDELLGGPGTGGGLEAVSATLWEWLAAPEHGHLLVLWAEAYARSLVEPDGPWAGFAGQSVADWLDVLAKAQPPAVRRTKAGLAERNRALALLRGALLDRRPTDDRARVGAARRRLAR